MYVLIFLLLSLLHFLRWMCFTGLCLVFARYDNIHIYECKYPSCWGNSQSYSYSRFIQLCIYTSFCFQFMYISRNFLLCLFFVLFVLLHTKYCHTYSCINFSTPSHWRPTTNISTCSFTTLDSG